MQTSVSSCNESWLLYFFRMHLKAKLCFDAQWNRRLVCILDGKLGGLGGHDFLDAVVASVSEVTCVEYTHIVAVSETCSLQPKKGMPLPIFCCPAQKHCLCCSRSYLALFSFLQVSMLLDSKFNLSDGNRSLLMGV